MIRPFEALYIHVPFCARRCAYCDFCTQAASPRDPSIGKYVSKLASAIERASDAGLLAQIRTIYIGGGTPSFAGTDNLELLLGAISGSVNLDGVVEFTMEANPDSLSSDMVDRIFEQGVDRISLGVQSLDDDVLARLGRIHDSARALEAISQASGRFDNISADVICGVPGQSDMSLTSTIERLVSSGIKHISAYPLMVEDGTPIARAIEAGEMDDIDDDRQADQMLLVSEMLEEHGLERYEVASYALPGYESKHNLCYWSGVPYLGVGVGASSMMDAADFDEALGSGVWQDAGLARNEAACGCNDGRIRVACMPSDRDVPTFGFESSVMDVEHLTVREAACEDIMLAMRKVKGATASQLEDCISKAPSLEKGVSEVLGKGLAMIDEDGNLVPTQSGWLMGNVLYGALWDCA